MRSGTIPEEIDKLIIWVRGSIIRSIDSFTAANIGILSEPAAVPGRKEITISSISCWVAG